MGNGGRSPGILDLRHWRWRKAVIFVVQPLYLDKVVAGPSIFSEGFGERINLYFCREWNSIFSIDQLIAYV